MTNDNEEQKTPVEIIGLELTPEQIAERNQQAVDSLRLRVAFLMDELKKIFAPGMLLTFIARSPIDPDCYSLLTEEIENVQLIDLLGRTKKTEPVIRTENPGVTN